MIGLGAGLASHFIGSNVSQHGDQPITGYPQPYEGHESADEGNDHVSLPYHKPHDACHDDIGQASEHKDWSLIGLSTTGILHWFSRHREFLLGDFDQSVAITYASNIS